MAHLLQVRNLNIGFKLDKEQLMVTDQVSFTVNEGEILGIVGESGCGKSVTALSVMGLLPSNGFISDGEILLEGTDLLKLKEKELDKVRGNEVAMVFQDVMNSLNPSFTIGNQLIEMIRAHKPMGRKEAYQYALSLLQKAGLVDTKTVMKKYPHMLSGGMRQRVMIAIALACKPRLLIADEPTTALDVTIQLQIMRLLKDLCREMNMAIILITHDMGVVAELADRVIVMYAGQCVEQTDVFTLFKNPRHPYTAALLRSIPGLEADRTVKLMPIHGFVPENYTTITGCRFMDRCPYASAKCGEKQEYREIEEGHLVRCCKME